MILKIPNKDKFVSTFLSPLSKVNDSCVIKIDESGYNCLLSSVDGGLILYCLFKNTNEVTEERRINVPDIGRLIKILQCIEKILNFYDYYTIFI